MAVTWEPLVRLISNLEKAHLRVPGNIPGKFQSDRTGGCRDLGKNGMIRWNDTSAAIYTPFQHCKKQLNGRNLGTARPIDMKYVILRHGLTSFKT